MTLRDRRTSANLPTLPAAGPEMVAAAEPDDPSTMPLNAARTVIVPDVRDMSEADSVVILREAGLRPGRRMVRRSGNVPDGHIVRTRPRSGERVPEGTKVISVVAAPRAMSRRSRRQGKHARDAYLPVDAFLSMPGDE